MKHLLMILGCALIFQGCTAIDEVSSEYDFVLGKNYQVPVRKIRDEYPPARILFLPIQKDIPANYAETFIGKFISTYEARTLVTPESWENRKEAPSREEVQMLAQKNQCGYVLFITLQQFSAYPPLHIKADVVLQRAANDQVLWEGIANYDASHDDVASSARRYLQQKLKKTDAPDKSLYILRNNNLFVQFAGWHLARHLTYLSDPMTPEQMKKKQEEESMFGFGIID